MVQLAKRHDGKTLTRLDELAQREAVSSNFLVQILNDLKRDGLVDSRRGKAGGYLLGRSPVNISLLDVVNAVEPSMLAGTNGSEGESGNVVRLAWGSVLEQTRKELAKMDLRTLAERSAGPMFYI
ncbi:HTH-type transcriptional regulator CymR [Haloferula sargassicola]|uniref:HTH-type transcriptional regulator CymR n=2 Tax=Haloferula sargassicola TaxID=490096 RepID=A0ABP9UGU2_9BACT